MEKYVLRWNKEYKDYVKDKKEIETDQSFIIYCFLDSEVVRNIDSYIELLQDPEFKYGMGNITTLDKPGDGSITLTLYPFENMDPEPEFKTTVDNLIKIIKEWDWIHKQKFPKVLMTVDGDKVTFEPIEDDAPVDHEQK